MANKLVSRLIPALIFIGTFVLMLGYGHLTYEPFSEYKNFKQGPLDIRPKQLKYYPVEEKLIRDKLNLALSQRERAILAGLHWIISFADKDDNFNFLFPDFMLLMYKMTQAEDRAHQKEVAESIVKTSLTRAQDNLSKLFDKSDGARWAFIGLLPALVHYPDSQDKYHEFYKNHFKPNLTKEYRDEKEYLEAIKKPHYKTLFDYLVQTSFLHYYLNKVKNPNIELPPDKFEWYLKEFEQFDYPDHPARSQEFRDLGYLATHVVLALTHYGEFPIADSVNKRKVEAYIDSSLEKAKELGDFDLLAEYVQCLKIFNPQDERIPELEEFIYSLQRPDGSWGSDRDFNTNPYTSIHPGGAALMALTQSNIN